MTRTGRMDRRQVVKGLGAAAATALLIPSWAGRVLAQTVSTGAAELTVVSDGHLSLPLGFSFPDAPQDELMKLLRDNGLSTEVVEPACNVTVVRTGDRLAIFDVGAGPNFMPTAGKLADSLAQAGIDPSEITDVVFTHAHPDHLWGLTDDFDELVFPEAKYHIGQVEWDFWSSDDALSQVPEDRQTFVVGAQNRFAAIEDRVNFLKEGDEVLPGVEAMATPGHTPGHLSYMVHGGEPVMILGDVATNAVISVEHPDWLTASDQDQQQAVETRRRVLDRLATDKARVIGFHFPQPGAGHIERKDGSYRFAPV